MKIELKKNISVLMYKKITLRREFDISKMKNYENTRKNLSCAMFYLNVVQCRYFFLLDEM